MQGPSDISLEGILNFRDAAAGKISKDGRKVKGGMIFRSAALDGASQDDIDVVVKDLKINTILDLRSVKEIQAGARKPFNGPGEAPSLPLRNFYTQFDILPKGVHPSKTLIAIDLIDPLKDAIWATLSWGVRLWALVLMLLMCNVKAAQAYMLKHSILEEEGLLGLNKTLILSSQKEMKRVIAVLLEPRSYPVLIHCSAGKDRTGLITGIATSSKSWYLPQSAILLACLEVSETEIVYDYALSARGLESHHGKIVAEAAKLGLSERFAAVDPVVMKDTLAFIREKYGSVNGYFTELGVSPEKRKKLREFLLQ
ncbi:hypothetical protein HDU97_005747 [Phlyctochytrium planicorne]|nr:hypothetical protein HDU97_005747 [Phlyctochytrium planicorne]